MKYFKQLSLVDFCGLILSCCSQEKARKPISQSSGSYLSESITRNKKMISGEELKIDSIIKSKPETKYIASKKGYWYTYNVKNELDTLSPRKGDIAYFNYEIKDLNGNIIYTELELRPQTYRVDKEQKMMIGLRDGIKLMSKNKTTTFSFISNVAYGHNGDTTRIGHNEPLICTVTLTNFEPESKIKTE